MRRIMITQRVRQLNRVSDNQLLQTKLLLRYFPPDTLSKVTHEAAFRLLPDYLLFYRLQILWCFCGNGRNDGGLRIAEYCLLAYSQTF